MLIYTEGYSVRIGRESKEEVMEKGLKKTVATFYFSMGNGGIEKVVTLLIRKWKSMGYRVILFTNQEPTTDDYINQNEVERIVLSDKENGDPLRKQQWIYNIEKYSIDIMIYHAWGNPKMRWDREVFQTYKIPFVVYTHGVFSTIYHDRNDYTPHFLEEIKKCDAIISLTKVSQLFYQMLGIKSIFMQNPIEPKLVDAKSALLDTNNIIWVGRMIPEKKPLDAIRILARVKDSIPNVNLIMVGKGPEEESVRHMCDELGLTNSVKLVGYTKDVEPYYLQASVMLYTSMYEGFSMVLLESKAYGLPCVMYELPYLSMTENPKGMKIVKQDDVEGASNMILKVLNDNAMRQRLGTEARESLDELHREYKDGLWHEIFEDSYNKSESDETIEKQMLELLLEHEEYGVKMTCSRIHNSMTYKVGKMLLWIPKYLAGLLWWKK